MIRMERVNKMKTFRDYIERFNPLGIVAKGIGLSFEGYDDCYDYLFDFLCKHFKGGIVDVSLLLPAIIGIEFKASRELVKKAVRRKEIVEVFKMDYSSLKDLFVYLHSLQGTALNREMFDKSFKKYLNKQSNNG